MSQEHIHFVTGRLAEPSLRAVLQPLASAVGFEYSLSVLNITVAALLTTDWIAPRLQPPVASNRILLPGYCRGDTSTLVEKFRCPVEFGPKDLRELPTYFQQASMDQLNGYDIEIIAEINHCPQLSMAEVLAEAARLQSAGANVIDVGCEPGNTWSGVGECVKELRDAGYRVSIDSLNPKEISAAASAGAELVLSVNSSNRASASGWGCEVVAIPDDPSDLNSLDETWGFLTQRNIPTRIDPVLEPIGFGFARSLERYLEARRRWPQAEMMMGIGNLTELTDVDSAGVNVTLLGFCQELEIRSVLTTQVINWAQSAVAECDLARRLVFQAIKARVLPKHTAPQLIMLRDPKLLRAADAELAEMAARLKDNNYRILLSESGEIHLLAAGIHLRGTNPYVIMQQLFDRGPSNLDSAHSFYLGYEMAKAVTALTLGKNYEQDEALNWGLLTQAESVKRLSLDHQPRRLGSKSRQTRGEQDS